MATDNRAVWIMAPSRIHFGLHDCGYSTDRIFGGVGVSFNGFLTSVEVIKSKKTKLLFEHNLFLSPRTTEDVNELVEKLDKLVGPSNITIKTAAPEHQGFGSKTTLLLSVAKATVIAHEVDSKYSKDDIIRLVKRGGTSGIGVNSFWTGGIVADSGHKEEFKNRVFQPSSRRDLVDIPQVVSRVNMPNDWRVSLFVDPLSRVYEDSTESEIFSNSMPLNDLENLRPISITYHGIIPSVLEKDIKRFSKAIYDMNHSGMKQIELGLQTEASKIFLEAAWDLHYAAGVSSFGPTIYIIHENGNPLVVRVKKIARSNNIDYLGTFEFNNNGAELH